MPPRKTSRRFRYPAALLTVAMLLGTSATPAAAAIDAAAIQAKAEAALAEGSPEAVEAAIMALFEGVSADDAGAVAAAVLAASKGAPLAARKAVGRALTSVSNTLVSEGIAVGAKSVVSAMQDAAAQGDNAALAVYAKAAEATTPPAPTGPVGVGLNPQGGSPGS